MKLPKLKKISAAVITDYMATALFDGSIEDIIKDVDEKIDLEEMNERLAKDFELINNADNAEKLVDVCRKVSGLESRKVLIEKILENQEETMPLVIKRFLTSTQDNYIEVSAIIFAWCEEKYVDDMLSQYKQIRSPYAQSEFCVSLGIRERKDCVDLLKKEYERLKEIAYKEDESYEQGPLLALHNIYEM